MVVGLGDHRAGGGAKRCIGPRWLDATRFRPAICYPEVWKNADCVCCGQWVKHLRNYNFSMKTNDVEDTVEIRKAFGMPAEFSACHTARAGAYVIEGHVPAHDILRLLRERPQARGLAVPEMPTGSPGMERGGQKDPYDVLLIGFFGDSRFFKWYR